MCHLLQMQYDLNERLIAAVGLGNVQQCLEELSEGAKATYVSPTCGRTAIGTAAAAGHAEILELLILSCEEPELNIFRKTRSNSIEFEVDITPEGMDLEWENEFEDVFNPAPVVDDKCNDCAIRSLQEKGEEDDAALYHYYAKTFERTGPIFSLDDCYIWHKGPMQDPHASDLMCFTPLHYAAVHGHVECVRILVKHGALIDGINENGESALHMSTAHPEVARLLLEMGSNPNLKTVLQGETPLHVALGNSHSATASLILEHPNVNINLVNNEDESLLMRAIVNGLDEIASTFLQRGARINLQNSVGRNALYFAVNANNTKMASELLDKGARCITSHHLLHQAVSHKNVDMVKLLLEHGESLNVKNSLSSTPLMTAISTCRVDILEYLLEHAASLYKRKEYIYLNFHQLTSYAVRHERSSLHNFVPNMRLLYKYAELAATYPAIKQLETHLPHCEVPLAYAMMDGLWSFAEFIIKEGVMPTRTEIGAVLAKKINNFSDVTPDFFHFLHFMVNAGMPITYVPQHVPPQYYPRYWAPKRRELEQLLIEYRSKPLSLQSLARVSIRKILVNTMNSRLEKPIYSTTKEESIMHLMIKDLGVPTALERYLLDFSDCVTLRDFEYVKNSGRKFGPNKTINSTVVE